MVEKYIRQYCKKNNFTRVKYIQLIDNLHIITMFLKLIVVTILSFYFVSSVTDFINISVESCSIGNNTLVDIDTATTKDSLILISIMITTMIVMSLLDVIDLMLWWERRNLELVISVLGNITIFVFISLIYTDIAFMKLLVVSIIEPSIYVFIFLVFYKKFQFKNGIYHRIRGERQ